VLDVGYNFFKCQLLPVIERGKADDWMLAGGRGVSGARLHGCSPLIYHLLGWGGVEISIYLVLRWLLGIFGRHRSLVHHLPRTEAGGAFGLVYTFRAGPYNFF